MKKSLFIIALAAMQCACSNQPAVPANVSSLVSFEQIGSEITVAYHKIDANDERVAPIVLSYTE